MNKLVLAASLAAATLSGCATSDDPIVGTDAVITARWSFTHYNGGTGVCPAGFDTVTINAQEWDPVTDRRGATITDKFNCTDYRGTTDPLDGIFLVWVQVESHDGFDVYAQSYSTYIDTLDGDLSLDFPILDDGGFFFLTWDLEDSRNGAPLSCNQAGADKVFTAATVAGTAFLLEDNFPCEHSYGTTRALPAGPYAVSISAEDAGGPVGTADPVNATISAPNGLTDLGHIIIPID